MSILTTTNVIFSIIRSLITKLLQPRKETTATTVFFRKVMTQKRHTYTVQGKHIYFALKGN